MVFISLGVSTIYDDSLGASFHFHFIKTLPTKQLDPFYPQEVNFVTHITHPCQSSHALRTPSTLGNSSCFSAKVIYSELLTE